MAARERAAAPRRAAARIGLTTAAPVLVAVLVLLPGCYAPQILLVRSGLDSLRTVVDTLTVRDSVAYQVLVDTRRELAAQRDLLLSTRATTGSTTQELSTQMSRLEARLDEVMGRFQTFTQRAAAPPPVAAPAAPDPGQMYDQAALDLTQGRYGLALQGFRELLLRAPDAEVADNAQYGVGECFFAQAMFDSAAVEYARVVERYPQGEKIPAALYKLALSQEKLGQSAKAHSTFEDLIKRFPLSGEAQLARERVGTPRRR
jgi:tol-pal system protein YbgF